MELYAVRYGKALFKLRYIFADMAGSEEFADTDWLFYLAVANGRVLLFDTGFRDTADAAEWSLAFTGWEREMEMLLGGRQVDTVVITHHHFDHVGNLDRYPGAKIVISSAARQAAFDARPEPVRRALLEGSVRTTEDEVLLEDRFRFRVVGGHDAGSAVVYFSSGGREYVLAGDESYACANILQDRPIGSVFCDREKNDAFTHDAHLRGLVPLPCHDAAIFEKYPKVSENIARIV